MNTHKSTALRVLLWLVAAVFASVLLVYFTGVVYFQTHFPFHTSFLGYDISQRTEDAVDECMESETHARILKVLELDGAEETIDLASAAGYRRDVSEPAEGWIQPGQSWRWPESLWKYTTLTGNVTISYDRAMLCHAISGLSAMDPDNITLPQSAHLAWQDDICVIIPEDDGNALSFPRVVEAVEKAVQNDADAVDLAAENCYRTAAIRSDDAYLLKRLARYEAINYQRIELDMTGATVTITPDDVLAFYVEADGELTLDEEAVDAFVDGLKERYDTYERQRPFVNRYFNEILVGTGADTYGFKLDKSATVTLLIETLENKERLAQIEPVWTNRAWTREENGSDIGDTYIEVSIADQYIWALVDGVQVFNSNVVTGNVGNHDTPRGVFRILNKERNAVLVGDDYETPVSYWMPITWRGVGLHDATWRGSFGGNIYTYDGSHGCINLPYWIAQEIFNTFPVGTPVVIW